MPIGLAVDSTSRESKHALPESDLWDKRIFIANGTINDFYSGAIAISDSW